MLDGVCTLIYMFMRWLRMAYEDHDRDVIEYVVPSFVASMRMMTKSICPEVIPTMTGLVVAAGTSLSPNLWRKQFGDWTEDEMNPLEATALLLAEHINRLTDDRDFATRMISEASSSSPEARAAVAEGQLPEAERSACCDCRSHAGRVLAAVQYVADERSRSRRRTSQGPPRTGLPVPSDHVWLTLARQALAATLRAPATTSRDVT